MLNILVEKQKLEMLLKLTEIKINNNNKMAKAHKEMT